MDQSISRESGYRARICTSSVRVACWAGAWAATCHLMVFGPKFLWNKASVFTLLAVGLNVCVGIGLIVALKNYIAELDELQRKIYLNALGIAVGVALIAGIPYSVLDTYDVIPFHFSILVILMGLTFEIARRYGMRRYR